MGFGLFVGLNLELQREIDGGIDEGGDRAEGNDQMGRDLVEGQADLEMAVADLEIPELVLEDDGHLVRETFRQMLGDIHPGGMGLERDVEMMRARQAAGLLHFAQHAADDRAQGLLHDFVIGNQAVGQVFTHGAYVLTTRKRRARMRTAEIHRNTAETQIDVTVNLDGTGLYTVSTGIGFLDHMIEQLSRHSLIDMTVKTVGDLHVDQHHTTEDTAIAIGEALAKALGDKRGISRYGSVYSPMDETLSRVALDISGRPWLVCKLPFTVTKIGEWDTEMVEHFFHSLAQAAGITLHIELLYGSNNHHIVESAFKGLARALRQAVEIDPRKADAIPSTKGML
ncbi:hypothetical protein LTR94_014342 [Friedmanniomyces endolithicus]|nr:hypothetical protein LTR94_014342 [Friedmanniomyces endolithicus]